MGVSLAKRPAGSNAAIYGVGPIAAFRTVTTNKGEAFVAAVADGGTGGTFGTYPNHGRYIVGGFFDAVVIRANATRSQRAASAAAFVSAHPHEAYGFWQDENGRTWLDIVRPFITLAAAVLIASENGERAIYDTELERSVPLDRCPCGCGAKNLTYCTGEPSH